MFVGEGSAVPLFVCLHLLSEPTFQLIALVLLKGPQNELFSSMNSIALEFSSFQESS